MHMTNTPAKKHTATIARRRLRGVMICAVATALAMVAAATSAQVVHPTSAERAQHAAHAQHLKSQQQSRKLRQQRNQRINRTASKAYKDQPKVQHQMLQAGKVRHRQFKTRNRSRKEKVRRAQRPLPTHVESAPARSQSGG